MIQWSVLIRDARHQWYISGDGDERTRYGGERDWWVRRTQFEADRTQSTGSLDRRDVGKVFACKGAMRLQRRDFDNNGIGELQLDCGGTSSR